MDTNPEESDKIVDEKLYLTVKISSLRDNILQVSGYFRDKLFRGILIGESKDLIKKSLVDHEKIKNLKLVGSCVSDRYSIKGNHNRFLGRRIFSDNKSKNSYFSQKTLRSRTQLCDNCKTTCKPVNTPSFNGENNHLNVVEKKQRSDNQSIVLDELSDQGSVCSQPVTITDNKRALRNLSLKISKAVSPLPSKNLISSQKKTSSKSSENKRGPKTPNKSVVMKKTEPVKRRSRSIREDDKKHENVSVTEASQKKSFDSNTDSSGIFSSSPVKLGISIRRVKDCEKPKNRWIKAERARRSQEVDSEPCYTSSIVLSASSNSNTEQSLTDNATYTLAKSVNDTFNSGNQKTNQNSDDLDLINEQPISLKIRINRTSSTSSSIPRVVDSTNSDSSKVNLKDSKFNIGDVVWSKLAGWPYWPAVVTELNESETHSGKIIATLRWFAWNQVSFMECDKLVPFLEEYDKKYNKNRKGASYHQAVKEAYESVNNPPNIDEKAALPETIDVPSNVKKTRVRRKRKDSFDPPKRKKKPKINDINTTTANHDIIQCICPTSGELPSFSNPLEVADLSDDNESLVNCRQSNSSNLKTIIPSGSRNPVLSVSITPPIDVVNISSSTCDDNTPTYSANGHGDPKLTDDSRNSFALDKIMPNKHPKPSPQNELLNSSPGSPRRKITVDIPTFSEAESEEDDLINTELNPGRLIIDQDDRKKAPSVSNIVTSLVHNSINSIVRNSSEKMDKPNPNLYYENSLFSNANLLSSQNQANSSYYNYLAGSNNTTLQQQHSNGVDYSNLYNRVSSTSIPSINNNNLSINSNKKCNSLPIDGDFDNRTTSAIVHTAFGTYSRPHHSGNTSSVDHFSKSSFQQHFHHQNQPKS